MTSEHRFELELPEILADLYLEPIPDQRQLLAGRFAATSQRAAWTFPERWLPMSVIALARQTLRPLPWRNIGVFALLVLLLAAALAIYAGTVVRIPPPFGPAANGLVAVEEKGDIALVHPVSGSRTVAVGGPTTDTAPAFSRDGTRLAFLRRTSGADADVWVSNADGTNLRQVSTGGFAARQFEAGPQGGSHLEWSPDGRSILLSTSEPGMLNITIVSTDGSYTARTLDLGMSAQGPTWRPPDGAEILFRGTTKDGFGLFAIRPDGTGLRSVVTGGKNEWDGLFFGWSPDGSRIAYQWRDSNGPQLLYVIRADGGQRQPITTYESVGVSWSPDGTHIAFSDALDPAQIVVGIVAADRPTQPVRSTLDGYPVSWSPDGTTILAVSRAGAAVLLDPATGAASSTPWSGTVMDWQRVALP